MDTLMRNIWNNIEIVVLFILRSMFRLFRIEESSEVEKFILQFIKFGIIGLSNTLLSYILYVASLNLFKHQNWFLGIDYLIAQIIAFVLSVAWSFYWNNKFVFQVNDKGKYYVFKALVKCYISYSFTGLFLNSILLVVWVQVLKISEYVAPILNLLISVPTNFIINKYWAFNDKKR